MTGAGDGNTPYRFSYGKFVLYVLGSGVLVLVVCVPIILVLAHWNSVAGLIAALVTVILMIATIGTVSKRQIGKAEAAMRARGQLPPT
ncbi:hypothetical protein GYA93_09405 [Gordonia desulfuricans]|uniref:Uncharacterized protein n=1 Tax=Gordonia desulfuricans TaxID=89051 RepID=A0A7K3LNG1_9ACTN|nr:hypothetical protein [Gordonia desulfuricans]NDK89792.1 hypothetical protein [Gordonia desulfuricans]